MGFVSPGVDAALFAYDQSCGISQTESARTMSGTTEITAGGEGSTVGRYEFVLDSGDKIAGTFRARAVDSCASQSPCD
jgi:hypothetical protein